MREIVASNTHPFHRHGQLMANDADVGNMLFLPNIMETAREYLLLTTIPVATTPVNCDPLPIKNDPFAAVMFPAALTIPPVSTLPPVIVLAAEIIPTV